MTPDHAWHPTQELLEHSNVAVLCRKLGVDGYRELQRRSVADPDWFWTHAMRDIGVVWDVPPLRIRGEDRRIATTRWFPGGRTNLVDSCLERHISEGRGDSIAFRWETEDGTGGLLDYRQLAERCARIASGLRALHIGVGDRVGAYLPPGREAFELLFACAHMGAVLVPMFSGFGVDALAERLADARAKVLVTADATARRGVRHDMAAIARRAAAEANTVRHLVVVGRDGAESLPESPGGVRPVSGRAAPRPETVRWEELTASPPCPRVSLPAAAPFLLLHTSGTTGRPKGAVHTHGGFPVQVGSEVRYNLDVRPGDVVFWVTDPGWVMFPLVAVGSTLACASVLAYDGAIDHPEPTRLWRLLEDHAVTVFGSSPSLSRSLMGRPLPDAAAPRRVRILGSTGEPWTEDAWHWYSAEFGGKRCPVINISGGTEVGGSLLGSAPTLPQSPCSFSGPCLGVDAAIVDAAGEPAAEGEKGELVVRQSWPGMTRGLWRAPGRFAHTYFRRRPGLWSHGDLASGVGDEWFVHGRMDDVIKVAGKRLGPAEVEQAVLGHPRVVEAAAVGVPHPVKGESLWCFVVTREGPLAEAESARIRERVAAALGPAFRPSRVVAVPGLPRTRNGKVMRRLISDLISGDPPGDLSALVDARVMDAILAAVRSQPR
ncbi:AMP-binding protein [Streptomyces sp. HNM0663]|uniref:acetate--CoA ligase n=1 Tax=Streptomyces chengmaiensis TaxID=3040919 RepID=A0ABT6HH13_9ACTN|nr:AMP-binding protein [Streptomyces chengmaiensis]MDH2388049.1 AMP-binding protein [Streptomyces chengmaiensis]